MHTIIGLMTIKRTAHKYMKHKEIKIHVCVSVTIIVQFVYIRVFARSKRQGANSTRWVLWSASLKYLYKRFQVNLTL